MTEIWNLSALCRCCHLDGSFKSLEVPYTFKNEVEVYSVMLQETLGVSIFKPPENVSYSICDVCIYKLRETINFKLQILTCEEKFNEYLRNEQSLNPIKEIKLEREACPYNDEFAIELDTGIKHETQKYYDSDVGNTCELSNDFKEEIKEELDNKELIKESCSKTKQKKTASRTLRSKRAKSPKLVKPEILFPCNQCEETFRSTSKLNGHLNKKHPSPEAKTPYTCALCPQQFQDIDGIYDHVTTHDTDKVKCRFCDKQFRVKSTQQCHELVLHIQKRQLICDICNKTFAYKASLRKHLLWHDGLNKKAFCELCGHGFNDKTNLRIHVESVHYKLRKFACTQCERTFTAKKHLKNHMAIKHHGDKPYVCKLCPATYCDWKSFRSHKLTHERKNLNPDLDLTKRIYHCKGCPEVFDDRGRFKAHAMRHNRDGSSPHMCHVCGRGFTCRYSLQRHVDNHSGLKRHSCDICQKTFTQKSQVDRHKRNVHDPVKRERTKCPICKSNVRDLEKHKKRHLIRPFTCELCSRSYPAKNVLNRHVKESHLGIFKHMCTICNTKCKSAKLLTKHIARRHPEVKTDVILEYDQELHAAPQPEGIGANI